MSEINSLSFSNSNAVQTPDLKDVTDKIQELAGSKTQRDAMFNAWMDDIKRMIEAIEAGHTEQAYQIAQQGVLTNVTEAKGGNLGVTASVMNVSSALTGLASRAQDLLNKGKDITPDQAAEFVTIVKQVYNLIDTEMKGPGNPDEKWIDNKTGQTILDGLNNYAKALGGTGNVTNVNDPAFNASNVQRNWSWASNNPTDPLAQAALQTVQSASSKWTNALTAFSTTLSAQVQFMFQEIGQYRAVAQSALDGTKDQNLAIIRASGK